MAAEEIKYLGQPGTERLIANLREEISTGDEAQAGALAEHKNDSSVHVASEEKEALLGAIAHVHEHNNKEVLDSISSVVDIYTQAAEPVDAIDGSIWFNTGNADDTISILVRRNGSWEISSDGVAQVQPDWDQTDASNPGYVRNKPFGYTADLYVNSTLPFAVGTNKNNIYSAKLPTGLFGSLQAGDNVTVVWDGTVYELTAKEVRVTDFFSLNNALGNGRIVSESYGLNLDTDTGEPFIIAPGLNAIYTRSTISTHSLQIKDDETIIKIDAKFLPDEALNASVQSDWNETDESSAAFIANKPEIPSTDGFATTEYVDSKFAEVEGGSFEQVQANWDQGDASQPDYILNKPFGYGPDIVGNPELAFAQNSSQNSATASSYPVYRAAVNMGTVNPGDVFIITWDGKTADYTAESALIQNTESSINVTNHIGNPYITGLNFGVTDNEDNGIPFSIVGGYINTTSTDATHSVYIRNANETRKIDVRFLPDEALYSPVQSDWNVTDEDDPAFIKNKPTIPSVEGLATESYVDEKIREINVQGGVSGPVSWDDIEDKPFGEIVTQTDVLPMGRFEEFTLDSTYNLYVYGVEGDYALTVGEEYRISWDGKEYSCEALDVSQMWNGLPVVAMGNGTAFGYPGNNEPFIIMCNNDNGFITLVCMSHSEPCEYHDVRIYQETSEIKKIDSEFLPDDIDVDVLPEVSADDNGKVLGVVDGEWKKIAVGGDGSVAVQPDWNQNDESAADYIKNKPFGDFGTVLTEFMPETTLPFNYSENDGYVFNMTPSSDHIKTWNGNWTEAEVVWDGATYACQAQYVQGLKCVGNIGLVMGGESTGEPFIMMAADAATAGADICSIISLVDEVPEDTSNAETKYHDVSVNIYQKNIVKLPLKYSHRPDWNESDSSNGSYIANRPFFTMPSGSVVVPETTVSCDTLAYGDAYFALIDPISDIGAYNYQIDFDGVICEVTARVAADGVSCYFEYNDGTVMFQIDPSGTVMSTQGSHTFKITLLEDAVFKIDEKYLPEIKALPEVTTDDNNKVLTVVDGAWEAAEPTDWSTLKNKPFYEETYSASCSFATTASIPTDNFTFENMTGYMVADFALTQEQLLQSTFTFNVDESTYEIPITTGHIDVTTDDFALLTVEDFPFIVAYRAGSLTYSGLTFRVPKVGIYMCFPTSFALPAPIDINILCNYVKTLDAKFIPTDAVSSSGSGLPEVTTDNNGQVMTVVDGAWVAQSVEHPTELPTVTSTDAGKFLRVSSTGVWVAESIQNAEEASF